MKSKVYFRKQDLIIIAAIFLIVFVFNYFRGNISGGRAEIIYDGNIVKTVILSGKDYAFSLDELPDIIFTVAGGKISFTKSNCPDQICVKTGFIHFDGESAACLPNKAIVRIIKGEKPAIDALSR